MMMRAVVIQSPGQVRLCEMPAPVCRPGEAVLKIRYGGICGSDLGTYRGTMAYSSYPRIPGHEFSGEIVEIQPLQDTPFRTGMLVTANPYFNCGTCYSCQRGLVNCCESNQTMGVQRDGAFSEYVAMPIERLIDGKGLPARLLALIEPFCISYHGVKQAAIQPGERVLVVGAGTIGVLAAVSAKLRGAQVYMSDISPQKLEYATQFGIDGSLVNAGPEAFAQGVRELTRGRGFDVTVEAVGLPETFQDCIDAAAFGGRMVQIGVGKKPCDFNFTTLQKKELKVMGSRNALTQDFRELIDVVCGGAVDLGRIVTNVYPFEQAPRAFQEFDRNAASMLKVLLEF